MRAYKYIMDVDENGHIKLPDIPQIKSSKIELIILPIQDDDYLDLLKVSESSLEFWDNPLDEVWDRV